MKTPLSYLAHALGIATVDLLDSGLAHDVLPQLTRCTLDALNGRSLLEALADDPAGRRRLFEDAFAVWVGE